jgi:oligopeptide/dipeptide ABC transporter ATP-binding protein
MGQLSIENLNVRFNTPDRTVLAVRDLSLSVGQAETIGIVGESGCGKTMTAYAILRLIRKPGEITSGKILWNGADLATLEEDKLRAIRGKEISMIFQEPMTSLNPVFKVGTQIAETIQLHLGKSRKESLERAAHLLDLAGIPDAVRRLDCYPHELSGGMRQRVMIAMALSADPSMLIADEPTTALDVTIQAQILDLLLKIQKERKMSLVFISHDLGVISNIADRIAVMYAGEICETGRSEDIFSNPLHPYTTGLFEAVPKIGSGTRRLKTIQGNVPSLSQEPHGCVYHPRCPRASAECLEKNISLMDKGNGHLVRCIKA